MSLRDLPPWQQRDERIRSHLETRQRALDNIRTYTDKWGEEGSYAQPDFNSAAKYDKMVDDLLRTEWGQLGDEPKTPTDKLALAERLEKWAAALRAQAEGRTE